VGLDVLESDAARVLDDAHALGQRYVVVPFLVEQERRSLDDYRRVGERLNRLAERLSQGGIALAYHNHSFEFQEIDGKLPYDVLLEATDPKLVKLEIDLYWMLRGRQDPIAYFTRWPGRTRLVHVKDSYGPPDEVMADVGAGIINWRRVFDKQEVAGIEHFLVERDDAPDGLASAAASFRYLQGLLPSPAGSAAPRGRLKQSVARWTIDVPLPELCARAKAIGLVAIDLLYPEEWAIANEAGLKCSMGYASRRHRFIEEGFNDPANHAMLLDELTAAIPMAARAGVPNLITMFGNRRARSATEGIANCVAGLAKVAPMAERHGVTICVELLNSKVDREV